MFKKGKVSFKREVSDYDQFKELLSIPQSSYLFGNHYLAKKAMAGLEISITQKIIKMFYVYLRKKSYNKEKNRKDFSIIYAFFRTCIFSVKEAEKYIKECDVDSLKQYFRTAYELFMQEVSDNTTLKDWLLEVTGSRELEYLSVFDRKEYTIKRVHDYIDFLELFYVSQTLSLDTPLSTQIARTYIRKSKQNLSKQTNIEKLKRGIGSRVLEVKISFLNQTMMTIRKDLEAYLSDEKYEYIKVRVMAEYDEYYQKLDRVLHLKNNFSDKIRTHMKLFELMNKLKMNWVCNCANINGGGSDYFYVYIYDIVMYKYQLLAYLYLHEWNKKTKGEVLASLDDYAQYDKDEMIFDFFNRHIDSANDLNAHIIKLFEEKYQKFIKIILAIETRTKYKKKDTSPTFLQLTNLKTKHTPLDSLNYFPIRV